MTSKRTAKKSRIPEFATREEEAAFWDTHDISDYWDELRPARARFAKQLSEGITIRLDPETLATLRSLAGEMGIGPTTLARIWILEHLRHMPTSPVMQRTAGALKSHKPPLTAEQLRESAERAMAEEAVHRMGE
jgi:hypothetical protein